MSTKTTATKEIRVLATSIQKLQTMQCRAERNRGDNANQWENSVRVRWDVSKTGNIEFIGWLEQQGTFHHEVATGFVVREACNKDGAPAGLLAFTSFDDGAYDNIPQSILEELVALEEDISYNIY